ncbi:MAG TPA: RNA polymerase sigma factor [Candidatus Sulfotelmatobacter sp.]|nr:RNA polymerase sigma factor [Candidatus Sulfotelmatobacter sp.]
MASQPDPQVSKEQETALVEQARRGDRAALGALVEPWRKPLFGYIYRMVTLRQDAEDLLQDVLVRVLENLREYRGEAPFKSWLFGIATHACLDHLRHKKRWRVEAQLIGEQEAKASPEMHRALVEVMQQPEFVFEIREHVAFCFACVAWSLPPEEQAALMLKEVLGFTAEEAAGILRVSEPVFRHRLSDARGKMIQDFDGLCALINKSGVCFQCRGLREFARAIPGHAGADLVQIEVAPGVALNPENLFNARVAIAREADLEEGATRTMHDLFFGSLSAREESR